MMNTITAGASARLTAAIAAGAPERAGQASVTGFSAEPGLGVRAVVDGRAVLAGRASWLVAHGSPEVPATLAGHAGQAEEAGETAVFIAWDGQVRGVLVVADTVKPGAADAIARLKSMGLEPILLTGDNERAARAGKDGSLSG